MATSRCVAECGVSACSAGYSIIRISISGNRGSSPLKLPAWINKSKQHWQSLFQESELVQKTLFLYGLQTQCATVLAVPAQLNCPSRVGQGNAAPHAKTQGLLLLALAQALRTLERSVPAAYLRHR